MSVFISVWAITIVVLGSAGIFAATVRARKLRDAINRSPNSDVACLAIGSVATSRLAGGNIPLIVVACVDCKIEVTRFDLWKKLSLTIDVEESERTVIKPGLRLHYPPRRVRIRTVGRGADRLLERLHACGWQVQQ